MSRFYKIKRSPLKNLPPPEKFPTAQISRILKFPLAENDSSFFRKRVVATEISKPQNEKRDHAPQYLTVPHKLYILSIRNRYIV